ncbi:MAG: circularly permuted type 2 ATP-grasp protein, partial [Candidatus Tectomicrobia bacterium]|nr:circularly permuted type 2 ATP-grasp protein [Candidatus Tectomicrobia bacterium]
MAHHVMTHSAPGRTGLFAGYQPPDGSYDETFGAGDEPRPHWQMVVDALESLGPRELAHCWQQARRMIHENGVTYNVYGDPQGMERPWELDPVPRVIGPAEWAGVEAALAQRARLLNALLADVYGPQRLLTEGLLPPELVFAHPGFLRPCHGLEVPGGCHLHVYAADLARAPGGGWQVLADRSQSPAGSGYALENRQVLSTILPEVMRDCQVQRLASYFAALRQTLHGIAPRRRDNPRVVLMTPGPYNETYFEHAFLARYLGYTLVEGGDLTVRDESVYLKTLAGLRPVDVILRRLDDAFCDPLELHQASLLGCAGLLQAVRAGNVAVANALGSGWLESPALVPLLPDLCRRLLDEDLALPSAPTWWCGDPNGLAYVLDRLEELVVMPA